MIKPIGILGGTFSPIHYGHLKPAEQLRTTLDLAEIRLLPCHRPPHRETPGVSSEMRAKMVQLACDEFDHFVPDLTELARDEPSFTAITMAQIRQEVGPATPLCFLLGMDSLLGFNTWYCWQQILENCHLLVSCRPGWHLQPNPTVAEILANHQTDDPQQLHQQSAGLIYLAEVDPVDISATQIRQRLAKQQSIEGLVPKAVADFIRQHQLYLSN